MLAARLLFVLVLLPVCAFFPGFFIVRRFRWTPLEKLCGGFALSLLLLYLVCWGIYVAAPGAQPEVYFAISGVSLGLGAASFRDLLKLWRTPQVKRTLLAFGCLQVWSWLMLSVIRVYSGAGWTGDWQEHFVRCLFFLQRFPLNTEIYPGYAVPARPPLMNVVGAFFLGQGGDLYPVFQVVFVFLNLLLFFACALLLPAVAGRGRRLRKWALLPLTVLFAMSPRMMENFTYTWTKSLAAFFVVLAIALYLAARRKRDSVRMVAAFVCLATGAVTHYSAGPYVIVLALFYLIFDFRHRPNKVRELTAIGVLSALILVSWLGWSVATYGAKTTTSASNTRTFLQPYQGGEIAKFTLNLIDTFIPRILTDSASFRQFDQPNQPGQIRDEAFVMYESNLLAGIGITGGVAAVILFIGFIRNKRREPDRTFWLIFVPATIVLGVLVTAERDQMGVAHLTMLPLQAIALAWLAAAFLRKRWAAYLLLLGVLIDFPLGVWLQARVQNVENSPGHTVFQGIAFVNGKIALGAETPESLSRVVWNNWFHKHQYAVGLEGLRQAQQQHMPTRFFDQVLEEDKTMWRGWYSRHGGEIEYLGDHFGDGWMSSGLMLLGWLAALWMLGRNLPPAAVAAVAQRAPQPKSAKTPRGRKR